MRSGLHDIQTFLDHNELPKLFEVLLSNQETGETNHLLQGSKRGHMYVFGTELKGH